MFNMIEKLRNKPEAYRMRVAFIVSALITTIIFLIWFSVLSVRFKNDDNSAAAVNSEPAFAEIREEFISAYETGKSQFGKVKKELENAIR